MEMLLKDHIQEVKGTTGSIKAVKGIPHNIKVQNGGTILRSNYGDGVEITRIEGAGNGGNELQLDEKTLAKILENGKADSLTYVPGFGPVNIKVVNPLKVKPGIYTIWFRDTTTTGDLNDAYWMITNELSEDTIFSTNTISIGTETIIFDLGISLNIGQIEAPGKSRVQRDNDQGIITVSGDFSDSSGSWLTGVPDQDGTTPLNWILSGSAAIEDIAASRTNESYYNDWNYYMVREGSSNLASKRGRGLDDAQIWERQAAGTIAPFRMTSYLSSNGPIPGYLRASLNHTPPGPSDTRNHLFLYDYRNLAPDTNRPTQKEYYLTMDSLNQLNFLSSVDIIFTADKSKWTRCPVFEMRDSLHETQGNAIRGQLRDAPSVDKNGSPAAAGATASDDPDNAAFRTSRYGLVPGIRNKC